MRCGAVCLDGLVVLSILLLVSGCQSSAHKHLHQAQALFDKRDLKGAQAELREAIREDPGLLDAHKSLANIDEYLADYNEAAREYQTASNLDPTDQKLAGKARYYRYLQQTEKEADQALDKIRAGDIEAGMKDLKVALKQTKTKSSRDHVIDDLAQAVASLNQQGDAMVRGQRFLDGARVYEEAVRGYMLLAESHGNQSLDPAADTIMREANDAADKGGAPDILFRLYNDVLALDPDNQVANMELAQVYIHRNPPNYATAAALEERAGAPASEIKKLREQAQRHRH